MSITLVNHVLVPCVFPGNPVPFPSNYDFGFTTTAGNALVAIVAGPSTVTSITTDAGDSFVSVCASNNVHIFWVQSGAGGATKIHSLVASSNFDCWIFELHSSTGTVFQNDCNGTEPAGSPFTSPSLNGGSGSVFYCAGLAFGDDPTDTVNSPWTMETLDFGGGYMCFGAEEDCLAAHYIGTGSQSVTFNTIFNYTASLAAAAFADTAGGGGSPTITGLSSGCGSIGDSLTIAGTNFGATQGGSTVTVNGTTASVTSWSDTSIVITIPGGATTGNVVVTTGSGSSNGVLYTIPCPPNPIISSLNPTCIGIGGTLTITGSNFGSSAGSVLVGGLTASISSWTSTQIVCVVPFSSGTTGLVSVQVTTSLGLTTTNSGTLSVCHSNSARLVSSGSVSSPNIVNTFTTAFGFPEAMWGSGTTANGADRITIGSNGSYMFGGGAGLSGATADDSSMTYSILVNGAVVATQSGGTDTLLSGSFAAGDYIQLQVTSGSFQRFALWVVEIVGTSGGANSCNATFQPLGVCSEEAVWSSCGINYGNTCGGGTSGMASAIDFVSDGSIYLLQGSVTASTPGAGGVASCPVTVEVDANDDIGHGAGGWPLSICTTYNPTPSIGQTVACNVATVFRAVSGTGVPAFTATAGVGSGLCGGTAGAAISITPIWKASPVAPCCSACSSGGVPVGNPLI